MHIDFDLFKRKTLTFSFILSKIPELSDTNLFIA